MQASRHFTYQLENYTGLPVIAQERDACGVGLLAQLNQPANHNLIIQALQCLTCMEHRGACSADRDSGDGAGITTQIPWDLFSETINHYHLKSNDNVGVAMVFLPQEHTKKLEAIFNLVLQDQNINLLGWRNVPTIEDVLGNQAKKNKPIIKQCFVSLDKTNPDNHDNTLFAVRKKIDRTIAESYESISHDFYICSFSTRIIVYKGMLRSAVLGQFYQDLYNPKYKSKFAIYHRRFSTNTMPKWPLAQPMRFIAHNGEINTLLGNLNWMKSRESLLIHEKLEYNPNTANPIINYENSDSANLDSSVELLISSGMSPEEALMILIPEAYKNQPILEKYPAIIDFYEYYSHLQESWDGPALVVFTDGKKVGATLDRNGLRPARYCITNNDLLIISSESGVVEILPENIKAKGRLGPGQMLSADLENNQIADNWMIKNQIANKLPYGNWLKQYRKTLSRKAYLEDSNIDNLTMMQLHTAFGYSSEDVQLVIEHMATSAKEPTFCMGDDIPLAILSSKPHILYDYFKQRFAQVTNPAIDPLRESLVMSLNINLGPKGNFLSPTSKIARSIKLVSPVINENELQELCALNFAHITIKTFFTSSGSIEDIPVKISTICQEAIDAVENGIEIIILSDKVDKIVKNNLFIPPLLIVGSVHHHLIKNHLRHKVSIIVETAQCWSTHHFACLIGYGASAICPYLAFKTSRQWWHQTRTQKLIKNGKIPPITLSEAQNNYRTAIETGLLKILSKMGISLISSYHGAQIFEILGLGPEVVDLAFRGTVSRVAGMNLIELMQEVQDTYAKAFIADFPTKLPNLGYVQYRPGAEYHVNNPEMSKTLHKAVRSQDNEIYLKYKALLENRPPTSLRDLVVVESQNKPISIDKVEPIESILARFCTGGMSLGALSQETHETLAVAMNRIGGKSNSGEGGEDPKRFKKVCKVNSLGVTEEFPHLKGLKNNDLANSSIKQIASGRFGVTPEYLMSGEQLEIKIAQGAKPGEGGQLPGKKVSPYIAELRNCKPGVTLISPPPHHDIYSIEDLSQLIFDLHQINPKAKVSVKLVSEIGIGTIAAGVVKGNADIIQISGHDGGTGASPLSSIKHAGSPWELGLTEVHQTLSKNYLRDRVVLRVDGGLRTGLDIILAAAMGAEEFGFGTIAMIATGCVMARICHTNNCPVGVATQRQDLRNRYPGIPADLVNFFIFVAEEIRAELAKLGYSNLEQMIGSLDLLKVNKKVHLSKTKNLNIGSLFYESLDLPDFHLGANNQAHQNGPVLDDELLADPTIIEAILKQKDISKQIKIVNTNRSVGARISGRIAKIYGNSGFVGNINLTFSGSAGQSYGAFLSKGMKFILLGEANDYVGKGMNGGELIIKPEQGITYAPSEHVIIGNTCLYGATGGYLFANGQAGERFAVRNSLANAVVEGTGDHACEYMTGGVVVVIGPSGRNIGAGMTGGIGYFLDEDNSLLANMNNEIVKTQKIDTQEGEQQLKTLIQMHYSKTDSPKAQLILEEWTKFLPLFWQVVPPAEVDTPLTNRALSSYKSLI